MAFERKQSLKDCGSFQGLIDSGTMPLVTVILRKFLFLIQCVVAGISRAFSLGRKKANIGELPFTVPKSDRAEYQPGHSSMPPQTQSWDDGWQNSGASFEEQAVSSKIEEYRRRKAEELQMREEPQASTEPDFFGDMQPTIKADKTVLFKNNPATAASSSKQPRNLFAFNEDSVRLPQTATAELGEFDFDSHEYGAYSAAEAWDAELDLNEVQATLEDQKKRERDEKHRQRREEHERRMKEKRSAAYAS